MLILTITIRLGSMKMEQEAVRDTNSQNLTTGNAKNVIIFCLSRLKN